MSQIYIDHIRFTFILVISCSIMKITLEHKQNSNGFCLVIKTNKYFDEFFKLNSYNDQAGNCGYTCYPFTPTNVMPAQYHYLFKRHSNLFYSNYPNLSLFTFLDQHKREYQINFKGLFSDDTIKNYISESNRYLAMFYEDLLKPYFLTKKYVKKSKTSHFEGRDIVNKEGYKKDWYSFYKNYKRHILPVLKEIKVKV